MGQDQSACGGRNGECSGRVGDEPEDRLRSFMAKMDQKVKAREERKKNKEDESTKIEISGRGGAVVSV